MGSTGSSEQGSELSSGEEVHNLLRSTIATVIVYMSHKCRAHNGKDSMNFTVLMIKCCTKKSICF